MLSSVMLAVSMTVMTAIAGASIVLKLWRHQLPEHNEASGHGTRRYESPVPKSYFEQRADHPLGIIAIAARDELMVLGRTIEAAVGAAELYLGICLVFVCVSFAGDDDETLAIAKAALAKYPRFIRLVPATSVHKKPACLNEIRRYAKQELHLKPFWWLPLDAEDKLKFAFLREVMHWFYQGYSIVQGPVQLINFSTRTAGLHLPIGMLLHWWRNHLVAADRRDSWRPPAWLARIDTCFARAMRWLAAQRSGWWRFSNCMEYFAWFTSRMVIQARSGVMPLGGNTLCIRETVLEATGGWELCLTEDCRLGMEASALGFKTKVLTAPEMATIEETPHTILELIEQRVRWMQGFIEVYISGVWRDLPTRQQRIFARFVLGFQYYQAFSGVLTIPLLLLAFTKVPVGLALFALVPFALSLINIAVDLIMGWEFGRDFGQTIRLRDYVGLALGSYPYQVVLAIAGVKAIVRHHQGKTAWSKTRHRGAALGATQSSERELHK